LLIFAFESGQKRDKLIFGISLTKSQKKCQIHRTG